MHTVYHTDAFILKSLPSGEANRRLWLFTKDFGLVVATVQGVRKQGAKLQGQLSEYSLISADLVRGKDVWRLVSATEIENPFVGKNQNGLGRAFVRTLNTVERFCQGEEVHIELFDHLADALAVLKQKELDARSFDTLSVWKVMVLLGYCAAENGEKKVLEMSLQEAIASLDDATRVQMIKAVNTVISETHL